MTIWSKIKLLLHCVLLCLVPYETLRFAKCMLSNMSIQFFPPDVEQIFLNMSCRVHNYFLFIALYYRHTYTQSYKDGKLIHMNILPLLCIGAIAFLCPTRISS